VQHIYPFNCNDPKGPPRTKENYLDDIEKHNDTNDVVHGVKRDCCLNYLKYFNAVESTCIDYMHSILEGVIKNFFNYWFEKPINSKFSLGKYMKEIDKRLLRIKPPKYIPNTPRSIYTHNLWRAHEYSTFILFYALPVFNGLMGIEYYNNLKKLVIILENLLRPEININELKNVEKVIFEFVEELSESEDALYPKSIMLSGVHEMLHLVDCFPFEELNRKIMSFTHGHDLIGEELYKIYSTSRILLKYVYSGKIKNSKIKSFITKNLDIKSSNRKRINEDKKMHLRSKPEITTNTLYLNALNVFNGMAATQLTFYTKIIYKGVYYCSSIYNTKRCDSAFITTTGNKGLIEKFIVVNDQVLVIAKKIVSIYNPFFITKFPSLKSKLHICVVSDEYFIEEISKIKKKFLIKPESDTCFFSTFSTSHLFN
jgi:hypothetical protein